MTLKDKVFGFDGRLRRRDYWVLSISLGLIALIGSDLVRWILLGPDYALLSPGGLSYTEIALAPAARGVMTVFTGLFLWPTLAMVAKRSHDRGGGAAIPMVLTGVSTGWNLITSWLEVNGGAAGTIMLLVSLISVGIDLYLVIILAFLDGTQGPNRFGPSPKGIGGTSAGEAAEVFS